MRAWHCPLCGLDFSHRTEFEWHAREDHRSSPATPVLGIGPAGGDQHDWAELHDLQSAADRPSVSLIMGTTPAPTMALLDAARLRLLAAHARGRLVQELKGIPLRDLEQRLDMTVAAAEHRHTDHGLALFVSATHLAVVRLPFRPRERVVVDTMFACRDLLDALHRFPRYRALVISGGGFRILEGQARHLREVVAWYIAPALPTWLSAQHGQANRDLKLHAVRERHNAVLAAAERSLTQRVSLTNELPLVLAGQRRLLARFREFSAHSPCVIGEVYTFGATLSVQAMAELAGPVLKAWCERGTARCLLDLGEADRGGRVAWGLDAVWHGVVDGRVERLWVERDYAVAARLLPGGQELRLTDDHDTPGVIDDVVDEIIDLVATKGAPVDVVDRLSGESPAGAGKPDHNHIAALLVNPMAHRAS